MMDPIIRQDMEEIARRGGDWDWLRGRTVLVTGAYGMLASYMVYFLIYLNESEKGADIRILAQGRSAEKMRRRFGEYMDRPYFCMIETNICRPITLDGRIDYIVHAAGWASAQYYRDFPVDTMLPNTVGTTFLLELAHEKKVQGFLFLGSGAIYGQLPAGTTEITEQMVGTVDPVAPYNCYAESKRMGEAMCAAWARQYGVPTRSVRIFHTYGPTCDPWHDQRVFAEFVANVVDCHDIVLKSDGSASRAFCYLTDATDAFFRILHAGEPGAAYNMANNDCCVTVRELAHLLVGLFPERGLKVVMQMRKAGEAYMENPVKRTLAVNTDALQALGWQPQVTLQEGFKRIVKFYGEGSSYPHLILQRQPKVDRLPANCRCALVRSFICPRRSCIRRPIPDLFRKWIPVPVRQT